MFVCKVVVGAAVKVGFLVGNICCCGDTVNIFEGKSVGS